MREKIFLTDLYMLFVESMPTLVGYFLKKFLFFLRGWRKESGKIKSEFTHFM